MAKIGAVIEDIEEGEISDIEEISEETFKQETKMVSKPKPKGGGGGGGGGGDSRVWMGDRMKQQQHSFSSNYGSALHNFAWAQAVQNKPLNEILVEDFGSDEEESMKPCSNLLSNSSSEDSLKSLNSSKVVCTVIIDDSSSEENDSQMEEEEEGELEEGEIELDVEMVEKADEVTSIDNSEIEIDRQVQLLREALETVNVEEAEKSFEGACSQLCSYLESLQLMLMENHALCIDSLIQLSFAGIQVVNSVFSSMTLEEKEKNKVFITRLLDYVESPDFDIFPTEQMKEIKAMMHSLRLGFPIVGDIDKKKDILVNNGAILNESVGLGEASPVQSVGDIDKKKDILVNNVAILNESVSLGEASPVQSIDSLKKITSEPISVNSGVQSNAHMDSESLKTRLFSGSKGSRSFSPLFDLHGDHDIDSLPSPTRETPSSLLVQKSLVKLNSESNNVAGKIENAMMHLYETDALKAVSTYQQKFGQTSCLLSNRLPSPTPSGECNGVAGDSNEEVSSSFATDSVEIVCPSNVVHSAGPASTPHVGSSSGENPDVAKTGGQLNSCLRPALRASAKHRDPRLRLAQPEVIPLDVNQQHSHSTPTNQPICGKVNSRKHNIAPESLLIDCTLKKQRNGFTDIEVSRDAHLVSHGWLEERCTFDSLPVDGCRQKEHMGTGLGKLENGETGSANRQYPSTGIFNARTGGDTQLTGTGTSTTTNTPSVPSLMKEVVVNPTMLMNLIMKKQSLTANSLQSSGDPAQIATPPPTNSSLIQGTGPLLNVASSKLLDIEQKLTERSLVPAQTVPMNLMDEWGKVHMKPRDPRRILRISTFQQNESLGPEQFKTNDPHPLSTLPSKEIFPVRLQDDLAQTTLLPSLSAPPSDISRQFTKRLKNVADILSTSQSANTHPSITQAIALQVLPVKTDKAEVRYVGTDSNGQSQTCSTPEEVSASSQPQNVWGDVEHLFKGYDEQQKAAIQRERARRIEEQNKMFAAQKLCLVLDLDHTLLNSAKFVEVEPVHQEMLRKKEEQDREKPQRHLFRLSHMGMWTKLRPGIWKFLEKASKLFELHLYTMGNKIYATEMAKVLDPTGVLFAGRVISKGDEGDSLDGDERVPKIKDLDGVLGMESAVVIIDDSIRVWPHNRLNLIAVERYIYFPCSRRQLGLMGPSLLEIDRDERSEDGTLASSLAVIERIHQNFFSHESLDDLDVRNILALEQRKILAGCRIVFSRVFPVCLAKPELHPLWQTAEQFGAVCTNKIDEQVTHVVANSLGTDKVNWALSTGRFVVYPGWVEASALLYRRVNEHDFAIKP